MTVEIIQHGSAMFIARCGACDAVFQAGKADVRLEEPGKRLDGSLKYRIQCPECGHKHVQAFRFNTPEAEEIQDHVSVMEVVRKLDLANQNDVIRAIRKSNTSS